MATLRSEDTTRRQGLWLLVTAVVLVAAMVGLIWLAIARSSAPQRARQGPGFDRYRPAWESAMAKAGVEATYPPEPVRVEQLRPSGLRSFSATFTAEEIGALINVYPYEAEMTGQAVALDSVTIAFPRPGVAGANARLIADNTGYSVEVALPLEYTAKGISSQGPSQLKAEGFTIRGDQKQQAVTALVAYLNSYLRAAPGLVVERAEIVEGGVAVTGRAPQRLENPADAAEPAVP